MLLYHLHAAAEVLGTSLHHQPDLLIDAYERLLPLLSSQNKVGG